MSRDIRVEPAWRDEVDTDELSTGLFFLVCDLLEEERRDADRAQPDRGGDGGDDLEAA